MGPLPHLLALFSNTPALMHVFPQLHTVSPPVGKITDNHLIYDALVSLGYLISILSYRYGDGLVDSLNGVNRHL